MVLATETDVAPSGAKNNPTGFIGDVTGFILAAKAAELPVAELTALVVCALGPEPNQYGRLLLRLCLKALIAELKAEGQATEEEDILRYLAGR